jgi:hypothetical protein
MELYLHNRPIKTIFGLLGEKENDITFSVGLALSRCDEFTRQFLKNVFPKADARSCKMIRLQESSTFGGFTDIEIHGDNFNCIIEAKKGWNLPQKRQLETYFKRLSARRQRMLVVLSECSNEYAKLYLPERIKRIPVVHQSWSEIEKIASASLKHSKERKLLLELKAYLRGLMNMQNQESNIVFVVALSTKKPKWLTTPAVAVLKNNRKYFHPFGGPGGWPLTPPNYLGFRYNGRLQSIHHVEKYDIVAWKNVPKHIPEVRPSKWEDAYIVYTLGPAIQPQHKVRTGKIFRSGRARVALDLLLTCKTISEAWNKTKKRPGYNE